MQKTTNISPDKSRSVQVSTKIKFDLNPVNYQCFISNAQKVEQPGDGASPCPHNDSQESSFRSESRSGQISELRIPYIRRNTHGRLSGYSPQFNTQVLLMEYDKEQVYTDSTKSCTETEPDIDAKSVHSETSEENDIVKSCLKMLADETDVEASISAKYLFPQSQYFSNLTAFYANYRCQNPEMNSFSIDLNNIEVDGRTTVMIRNIPNKYTEGLLLELFNKNHKKKIDFFYLPIDYKNNCNVGYAFLNFIHPRFIVDFYTEFHNKKWKLFNSEKICHICYARIQGAYQLSHHIETSKRKEAEM